MTKPHAPQAAPTEVATHMSFDTIRYAQVWEDSQILNWALQIQPEDHILSITSAGCNVLSMLLKEPASIYAVDLNPIQNAILALKLYALQSLDHQGLLEVVGSIPSLRQAQLLRGLQHSPWGSFVACWPQIESDLAKGLLSLGRLDTFLMNFAHNHFARIPNFAAWRECFEAPQLAEQRRLLPMFETNEFKVTFAENFGQAMLEKGRDPAQFRYVSQTNIGEEFYRRFIRFLRDQPLHANPYNHFFMFGEAIRPELGPDYLQSQNFTKLRRNLHKVQIRTATIEEVLLDPRTPWITKANLSNIFEYMSEDNMSELLLALSKKMPEGGRIAFWNLLVDRSLPKDLAKTFRLLPIPGHIRKADRVWFYQSFHVLERL